MDALLQFLVSLNNPTITLILAILGTLVVLASIIDGLIPDGLDHGFYKKLEAIPLLGLVFSALKKFSVLRGIKETPKE